MSDSGNNEVPVHDLAPDVETFRADVLEGLTRRPKRISSKYLYDERGSKLFDQICELEEYYPTRTELDITRRHAPEMAAAIGAEALLIEFGSGSSIKTRVLLDNLDRPAAYVPVDISREHLESAAATLAADYPHVPVLPVCADFLEPFEVPPPPAGNGKRVVYFPGSTIGNFTREGAVRCLRNVHQLVGSGGGLLIGFDLKKDPAVLEAAYNDAEGVTAAFTLNLLVRINRELHADFDLNRFRHRAVYNEANGRIETDIVSECDQVVTVDDVAVPFEAGEGIRTEYSHKYDEADVKGLADAVGMRIEHVWKDPEELFSVQYLAVA